jgi:hypothetical protein
VPATAESVTVAGSSFPGPDNPFVLLVIDSSSRYF